MTKLNFPLHIIKDYPKPGINFIDINPLLANPTQFEAVINAFCDTIKAARVPADTAILAPEARGFLFAAPVAHALHLPLILIRKEGKIPNKPYTFGIVNEYTAYNMEIDADLLHAHNHYIYIDDILATGQTLAAVRQALRPKGKEIALAIHLTDVADLKEMRDNNDALRGLPIEVVL